MLHQGLLLDKQQFLICIFNQPIGCIKVDRAGKKVVQQLLQVPFCKEAKLHRTGGGGVHMAIHIMQFVLVVSPD